VKHQREGNNDHIHAMSFSSFIWGICWWFSERNVHLNQSETWPHSQSNRDRGSISRYCPHAVLYHSQTFHTHQSHTFQCNINSLSLRLWRASLMIPASPPSSPVQPPDSQWCLTWQTDLSAPLFVLKPINTVYIISAHNSHEIYPLVTHWLTQITFY
jgi:hypothetical protein